jgi:hypothetical protein
MRNSLINIINNNKEILPLQVYFWEVKDIRMYDAYRSYVSSNIHNTNKYEPYTFYKPINQIF